MQLLFLSYPPYHPYFGHFSPYRPFRAWYLKYRARVMFCGQTNPEFEIPGKRVGRWVLGGWPGAGLTVLVRSRYVLNCDARCMIK
jgi:hypothetical protein